VAVHVLRSVPYLIQPADGFEAQFGKPVLLTDCEIALVLDSLQAHAAQTSDGIGARDRLWNKLLPLWNEEAPYARWPPSQMNH
jgi:hypothetical protein